MAPCWSTTFSTKESMGATDAELLDLASTVFANATISLRRGNCSSDSYNDSESVRSLAIDVVIAYNNAKMVRELLKVKVLAYKSVTQSTYSSMPILLSNMCQDWPAIVEERNKCFATIPVVDNFVRFRFHEMLYNCC